MRVRFEPVGFEITCGDGETVLDGAFRQGYNLVYGCREGQCSACKCFLLEGDAQLKPYSNFALSDSERAAGYSLMCRAMPDQDLVVELLHFDPDAYRLEHPIGDFVGEIEVVRPLTQDIFQVVLRVSEFQFTPGQYVDVWVPGERDARRSFSIANLPGEERIELVIKRYPGGRLSGMLGETLVAGSSLRFTGPYGSLRLRDGERPILMIAGGSGMAPILSLLRQLAGTGCERPVRFFYGARTEGDLFWTDEIARLGARLADFRFAPVVERFVHEAVSEFLASPAGFTDPDVYMCGPPPMVEAASEMLTGGHGVDEQRVFLDKFTTSAAASPAAVSAVSSEREFAWFAPAGRRPTLYEDVTIDTQPSVHRHLTRGWPVSFEDGRGTWEDRSTSLRCTDWFAFRDPRGQWERPFYQAGAMAERQLEATIRSASRDGLMADFSGEWVSFLRRFLQVPAYVEHGLWFALATIGRDCLSDSVATCVCLQAAMKQRSAQAIVLYAMDLEQHHGGFPIEDARDTFLNDSRWQPTRRYLERLAATEDWGEVVIAANLCFEPVVGTLLRREIGIRAAAAHGDTVTPALARVAGQEWDWTLTWTTALVRMLLADSRFGAPNRRLIDGWVAEWSPRAVEAAASIASMVPGGADLHRVRADASRVLGECEQAPQVRPRTRRPVQRRGPSASVPDENGYDFVGIVMAKSAEGDAIAAALREREDVTVIEQPAFWDIRARDRLSVSYAEISEQLGYEIDAYSIQHEMSTHYGRMVATDETLMLFSDPTEAMAYLMA